MRAGDKLHDAGSGPRADRWKLIERHARHQPRLGCERGLFTRCDGVRDRAIRVTAHELEPRAVDVRRDEATARFVRTRRGLATRDDDVADRDRRADGHDHERRECHRECTAMTPNEAHEPLAPRVVMREHELAGHEPPQIRCELGGRWIARGRITRECALGDRAQIRWHAR